MNSGGKSKKFDRYRLDPWEPCETITPCDNKIVHYEKSLFDMCSYTNLSR